MCAVYLMTCATGWSSIFFFHFWELTGFITVSAVSFQFTNISSQFGDSCLYVGNSDRQGRNCTLEYICLFLLHKQQKGHPEHLRAFDLTLNSFRHSLKTFLFTPMTHAAHWRLLMIVGYTSLLITFAFTPVIIRIHFSKQRNSQRDTPLIQIKPYTDHSLVSSCTRY